MPDKPAHRDLGNDNHHINHRWKRPLSSDETGQEDDDAPRSAKRTALHNGSTRPASSISSSISVGPSDFRKPCHFYSQPPSPLSRTHPPRRRQTAYSSRPSISHQDNQQRQGPTIVERAVSQLRMYMDNRLNDVKEQLCAWEANGNYHSVL